MAMSSPPPALAQTGACVTGGAVTDSANSGLVSDCEALLEARDTLAGTATLNWSNSTAIAQWDGITLRGTPERVTRLDLRDNGLDGSVPAALGRITELTYLNLRTNDLGGSLPAGLGDLTKLTYINFHSNQLSGSIPDLSDVTGLEELYLPNNMLTGPVPAWLNDMTAMRDLWLWGNELTGTIPDLSGMTSLEKLKLAANDLEGGVPEASALPADLRWLIIQENPLGGTIPDLSSMTSMTVLWLHTNELTGQLPASHLPSSLTSLNLHSNHFSGAIPDLTRLDRLQWLRLQNNRLSGTIPTILGDMDSLTRLWLHGNMLDGTIPAVLGDLAKLERLWLSDNELTGDIPEVLGDLGYLVEWRLAGNDLTGCVPAGLAAVEDSDLDQLGLGVCGRDAGVGDLAIETPSVDDASPAPGATFTLSATVTNAGDVESAATTLRYYRSTDATITTTDTEVGTDSVGALAAAGASDQSIELTAPSTPGTYYYGACVDSLTGESDTSNNCSAPVKVDVEDRSVTPPPRHPDLEVETPSVDDANPAPDATFTLSATVTNEGDGESAATTLRYYRSTDATITTADTEVGTDAVGALAAAGASDQSIELAAPSTPGTYYYGACVDSVTGESDASNNCSAPVKVDVEDRSVTPPPRHPDLVVGTPSVDAEGTRPGETFTLSATVSNAGDGASAATTLRYYRSTDSTITTTDTEVGTDAVGALAPAGASDQSIELTVPSATGIYYGACVDSVTGESDTSNNCSEAVEPAVELRPDLELSISVNHTEVSPRAYIELTATVTNEGEADATSPLLSAGIGLSFYRSEDSTITSSDDTLRTAQAGTRIAPGGSVVVSHRYSVRRTAYYGACVYGTAEEEWDASNNCSDAVMVAVVVRPDLTLAIGHGWTSARVIGGAFYLTVRLENEGDGQSAATTLRYYRSTDTTITTSDTEVGTADVDAIWPGGIVDERIDLTAPSTAGTYYYGACVAAVPDESDTTNNCTAAATLFVPPPSPDLTVLDASVDDRNPVPGGSFTLSATMFNRGSLESEATTLRYYRTTSASSITPSSDTEVGTGALGALASVTESEQSIDLTAPSTAGHYYYYACVDAVADESDTTNNCSASTRVTAGVSPDLEVGTPSVDDDNPSTGQTFTVSVTVTNDGYGGSPATTLRYYRSDDATITTSDTGVGTDAVGAIEVSAASAESFDLYEMNGGTYYYGACVDSVANESDTTNNCSGSVRVVVEQIYIFSKLIGLGDVKWRYQSWSQSPSSKGW